MRPTEQEIQDWIVAWVSQRTGTAAQEIDRAAPLTRAGLDSLALVRLTADLELWLGYAFRENPFLDYPSITALARYLAEQTSQCK